MLFVISLRSVCTAFIFSSVMKDSTLKDTAGLLIELFKLINSAGRKYLQK